MNMPTSLLTSLIEHLRKTVRRRGGAEFSDGELLGRFIERHDEAALATLVQRHGPMVWGVCRRLLNHHDAEDAFQATFLVLVRKAASIVPRAMLGNWLYGVARQSALQARRTAARRRAKEVQVTVMPETEAVQHDQWADVRPLLDEELSHLPNIYRAVVVLCDLEGRSRKEVAGDLGLPEGTVASRLVRGRALLAKRLTKRGVTLSGGALTAVLAQRAASAVVPNSVLSSTINAANLLATGQAAAGLISAKVAVLTEGVLKAMFLNKLKGVLAVGLVALICIGGGVMVTPMVMGKQSDSPKKADDKKQEETKEADDKKQEETKEAAVKAMQERLQGTWKCVFMQHNGVKSEPDLIHTIKGNSWESKLDGRVVQSGTFKLVDLDASPKQIDSLTTSADAEVVGERKDKTNRGIFMLDGDTLIMCVHDDERPKGFITQADDGCTVAQFKRVAAK
jgi:RNA polymerase sigma factor (sigma-70 family)